MEVLNFLPISTILLTSHLFLWSCEGAYVMIYTHENFTGSAYALDSTPNCTNLPTKYKSSIRTTGCIAVYHRTDCSGRSFLVRSDKTELRELTDGVEPQDYPVQLSFRECTDLEYGPGARLDLQWDLYSDSEQMERETHGGINCECIWLTWRNYDGFFANTHGSCFKVYNNANCEGNPVLEVNGHEEDIPHGGRDGGSMQLCNMPPHCLSSLKATVFNMKLVESNPKLYQATTPILKMLVNNGSNSTEDFYNTTEIITEMATFSFPPALKQLYAIDFEEKAVRQFKNSMMTVSPASKALVKDLAIAFKNETSVRNVTKSYQVSHKKEFQVHKKVIVPKCTDYTVSSFIESSVYPQTRFLVQIKITGMNRQSNATSTSSNIRKSLEIKDEVEMRILDRHDQADNFSVVAEVNGLLYTRIAHNLVLNEIGLPNLDCYMREKECTFECKK